MTRSVEFVGTITTQDSPQIEPAEGAILDLAYLKRITKVHESAGFDKVLVPFVSTLPDTFMVAQYAAHYSRRLGFALAHRAGFVAPTVAARALATLDQITGGRIAVHLVTGGTDAGQRRDGDYLDKDSRYRRTNEYMTAIKTLWSATGPIDFDGEFYRFESAWSHLRPVAGAMPVYFGGASAGAHRVAGVHADVAILWGEPLAETAQQIEAIRSEASKYGRANKIRFELAIRPIVARNDKEAWNRAGQIQDMLETQTARPSAQRSAGFERLVRLAESADIHDKALWTVPARMPGARGNATALVGSPDTIIQSMLDYVSIGISGFVINGYDPIPDTAFYGRHIIPEVRRRSAAVLSSLV